LRIRPFIGFSLLERGCCRFSVESAHVHTGNAWHRISDHAALTAKLSPA